VIGTVKVAVTVTIGRRTLPVEQVTDRRIAAAFDAAARDIGKKLDGVKCPAHGSSPRDVRVHFDARGAADLKYDSCCPALGEAVSRALG
jgi:hypothetical protein